MRLGLSLKWVFVFIGLWFVTVHASSSELTGYWLTRKDDSHLPSSIILLSVDQHQKMVGRVVVGFYEKNAPLPSSVCHKCSARTVEGVYGVAANQDIVGSYAVWGFEKKDDQTWVNGKVVRIKTGQIYRSDFMLRDSDHLDVRVRYGIFYKTLHWERLTKAQVDAICRGDTHSITSDRDVKAYCLKDI